MKRACFIMKVKKDRIEDYLEAHQVWPEMKEEINRSGIKNYSMFIGEDGLLVNYFESDDPMKSLEQLAETEISKRWEKKMVEFFENQSGNTEEGDTIDLKQIFYIP